VRISKFRVAGLGSYEIVASGLDVICNMLAVAALVSSILAEANNVSSGPAVVPDIYRLQVYVVARLTRHCAIIIIPLRTKAVTLPDLVRSRVLCPTRVTTAISAGIQNTKHDIAFVAPCTGTDDGQNVVRDNARATALPEKPIQV